MKKFYYKKDVAVDKSPIILPLERRHTMDENKDWTGQEQNRLSTRATSVGSFDQLKDGSAGPEIKTREITKCLSEDILHRGYLNNSTKVITERELSSSRLYKTRKASINSKDSPQQVPQRDNLSPVVLKDPNLKPIPIKSKARNKRDSSCLCYCSIFIVISLCTIGFLAAVTGLLYGEIFTDKNSTSHQMQETMIDITDLIQETQSQVNSSTYGFQILGNETTLRKISFENTDYESDESRISASNVIESENIPTAEFGKLDVTDLTQFLDSTKAEIKFQDRDTIIYEMNANSSVEYDNSTNILNTKMEEIDSNENITGNDSKNIDEWTDEVSEVKTKGKNLEMLLNPLVDKLKGQNQELKSSEIILNDVKLEGNLTNSRSNVDINSESEPVTYTESNESGMFAVEKHQKSSPNAEVYVPSVEGQNETVPTLKDNKVILKTDDPIKLINDEQGSETEHMEENLSENTDQIYNNKSEHDVESMLMVINEPEDESQDPVFVNRNGDINLIVKTSSFETRHTPNSFPLNEDAEYVVQLSTEPQNYQEYLASNEQKLRIKPLDMKVSLVEAMKHLQALDVNNKLLSSRIKSVKIKAQLSNKPNSKENMNMEKMQYLRNLRLVLQENLQGI